MQEHMADEPLLAGFEPRENTFSELSSERKEKKKWLPIAIGCGAAALAACAIVLIVKFAAKGGATSTVQAATKALKRVANVATLPGCQAWQGSMSCQSSSGDMDSKWADHLWNTPPRGAENWKPGYQDMNVLVGYVRQIYSADHKSCTVKVITKTAEDMQLSYFFDNVGQSADSKVFDSSYTGVLSVKVKSNTGAMLELPPVDFMWNNQPIKQRNGDYRNGQKGAIIEMFGWPDEDVALECQHIAEAGYLGVKLFPHQEQIMSYQPFNAGSGSEMNPWSFMYQPVSYRLDGRMGSRAVLRETIKKCRSYGVRVYADAVVNHMSGNGNDMSNHRNPNGCVTWPGKNSSAKENQSPFYTPAYTYEYNPYTGKSTDVLEYPGVPYGPMDFHCDKSLNSWSDANILNTGWLVGLADLDTSRDYVRQRIADFFVDLISIGFSGFRIDAAKHIHPTDLAAIFAKFKAGMGGNIPEDFITWLEVLTGGEAYLLVQGDGDYSYTGGFTKKLQAQGLSESDILKIKIWWCGYPTEPDNDYGSIDRRRKVIENDDHDQQNPGSSSRDMHGEGCVLVKGCDVNTHRNFEKKLFDNPNGARDNDNDYPIRLVLSSYYFTDGVTSIPDGESDCSKCLWTCGDCKTKKFAKAYQANAQAYAGTDYTRVHRDQEIINSMRRWMHI